MKKFTMKPDEAKTSKTRKDDETATIDESCLDSVERKAISHLAFNLAMRRVLKDMIEGKDSDEKEPPRGILSDLMKDDDDDELKKLFHIPPEMRIHLDDDEDPWEEADDDDEEDDDSGDDAASYRRLKAQLKKDAKKTCKPEQRKADGDSDDELPADVNSFLRKYRHSECMSYIPKPHIECADGYMVSIQGGQANAVHCWPQEDADEFSHVEVALPSVVDEELLPYRFELDDPEEVIFHFVPVPVMDKVLQKHGGITGVGNEDEMFVLMDQILF